MLEGRREKWGAGEEKDEGLLRTVFKSWLLIAFSRTVQEFSVGDLTRRSAGVADIGYCLSRRPSMSLLFVIVFVFGGVGDFVWV